MKCRALTRKQRPCPLQVKRKNGLCHVHDPNGKFRMQQKSKGYLNHTTFQGCKHTWYMREVGIQCTKCLAIWQK
jgi:hypothetical protein